MYHHREKININGSMSFPLMVFFFVEFFCSKTSLTDGTDESEREDDISSESRWQWMSAQH